MNQLCLRLVQRLVRDGHDLVQDVPDVLFPPVPVAHYVVSVWRWQSHGSPDRVAGQIHAAEGLH